MAVLATRGGGSSAPRTSSGPPPRQRGADAGPQAFKDLQAIQRLLGAVRDGDTVGGVGFYSAPAEWADSPGGALDERGGLSFNVPDPPS